MTPPLPRPCSPAEAVERALAQVGRGVYALGGGGYYPDHPDSPFTIVNGVQVCDCWRFAGCWCWKLPGHRPHYNEGSWATVSDDENCDSALEQAEHPQAVDKLWRVVDRPALGDLLVFPSIRGPDHKTRLRIGHVGIVVGLCAEWDVSAPQYGELEVVQCQSVKKPAIQRGPGSAWMFRDKFRGAVDERWQTRILRSVP